MSSVNFKSNPLPPSNQNNSPVFSEKKLHVTNGSTSESSKKTKELTQREGIKYNIQANKKISVEENKIKKNGEMLPDAQKKSSIKSNKSKSAIRSISYESSEIEANIDLKNGISTKGMHSLNEERSEETDTPLPNPKVTRDDEESANEELGAEDDLDFDFFSETNQIDEMIDEGSRNMEAGTEIKEAGTEIKEEGVQVEESGAEAKSVGINRAEQGEIDKGAFLAQNKAIERILAQEAKKLTRTEVIDFKDGHAVTSLANQADRRNLSQAMNQNRLVLRYENTLYVHPSLGLERGRRINIEDANGKTQTLTVEHFTKEQVAVLTIAMNNFLYAMYLPGTVDKKDKKEDQRLVNDQRNAAKLNPNELARKKAKETQREETIAKEKMTKEQKEQNEIEANRLKQSKMQDEKAEATHLRAVKTEERRKDKRDQDVKDEGIVKEGHISRDKKTNNLE